MRLRINQAMRCTTYVGIILACFLTLVKATPESEDTVKSSPVTSIMEVTAYESTSRPTATKCNIVANNGTTARTHNMEDYGDVGGENNVTEETEKETPPRPSRRDRRKALFDQMVAELGENDEKKMLQLTTAPDTYYREMNSCFKAAYDTFARFCRLPFMGGGVKYFNLLLSLACEAKWLDTDKICITVKYTCQPRLFGRNV